MERALTFAGYEVNHTWGEGAHSGAHSAAIFPDAMRWLWKDYPAPVKAGKSKNAMLGEILIDGEGWEMIEGKYGPIADLQNGPRGELYFQDAKSGDGYMMQAYDGSIVKNYTKPGGNLSKSSSSSPFQGNNSAFLIDKEKGTAKRLFTGALGTADAGKILILDRKKKLLDQGLSYPYGLAFTPDRTQLYVTESNTHWVWIYTMSADGTLSNKQRYGWLHSPDTTDNAQPRGIKVDRDGRVYVATALGIQVLDQVGRVNAILPLPYGAGPATELCFGGKGFNELYVICGNKIYRRKLNVRGMNDFDAPVKPARPHL